MPRYTADHPGPLDALRPANIGAHYVQPTLEYHAGHGFTTKATRGSWDVRTIDGNRLVSQATTRISAVSEAHQLQEQRNTDDDGNAARLLASLYSMDNETYSHLSEWCDRTAADPDAARVAIVEYLESLTVEDAEYSLGHGWPHVWALIDPAR